MTRIERIVARIGDLLIRLRRPLSVLFIAATAFFGWSATHVKLDPGFFKLIPVKHEYMKTMMQYMKDFSDANMLLVNLRWNGQGDMYNKNFMEAMRKATDDVFFIPGINRTQVASLFTPSTYYIEITEDGFKGEPVVPARYTGTPEELERIRRNVGNSGQIGLLVANDLKGALIRASLVDVESFPVLDSDADGQLSDKEIASVPRLVASFKELDRDGSGALSEKEYDASGKGPADAEVFFRRVMTKLGDIRGRFESPQKYTYTLKADHAPYKAGDTIAEGYVDYGWKQRFQMFYAVPSDGAEPVGISGSELSVAVADNPDYDKDVEVNIIGFAQLLADVINGLIGVFAFFALAFVITVALLYVYTRSLRLTVAALVVAMLPVIWLIGTLPLIGFGVDPMSILVPFLIFSIGVSHAVQMTNAWRQSVVAGADSVEAARSAFTRLFVPGAVALLTNALGFAVIMLIDIPIVHELGITACTGVLLMIITNKMILPILLTHVKLEESSRQYHAERAGRTGGAGIWNVIARCAQPNVAVWIIAVCLQLLAVTTWMSRGMVIGDSGQGAPELRAEARYNADTRRIASSYDIGADVLTVIAEAKDFAGDSCLQYPVVNLIDRFELFLSGVDGVQSVKSVAGIGKLVIAAFNEGNPRFRALPRSDVGLSTGSRAFDPGLGFNNDGCRAIRVLIFTKNHEGTTIAHVVEEIKRFIADNPVAGVKLRLGSGNVGVMAATNEAVAAAEVKMLLAIFGALALLCLLTFRSIAATLCVLVPLTMVSIFCNALMASLGIGLKVATLPVVALGVGVGVDYGIYLFERIQHDMGEGMNFHDAFLEAMRQRGTAAVFTAITMAIGVGTWTMSALKFQGDMGLLLSFMFLVNMLGAICLLPALGAWFYKDRAGGAVDPAAASALK